VTLRAGKATIGAVSRQGDYVFEREWSDFGPLVLAYVDILGWSDLICSPRTIGFNADLTKAYAELITGIRSGALTFEGGHRRVAPRTSLDAVFRSRITS